MVLFVTRLCEIDVARRPHRPRRPQRGTPPPSSSSSSAWHAAPIILVLNAARRPRRPRCPRRGTPPPSSSLSSTWLLCESRLLASFGGSVTRTGGGCVVWVLSYTKRGCLRLFEAGLCKLKLLASFGGTCMRTGGVASFGALVTRNEAASVVWRLVYMRGGCWRRLGAGLCAMKLLASLGAWLCNIHLLTYLMGLPSHFHTPNAYW